MPGYDLDILVRRDNEDGYKVTRTLAEQVRQKLIILLMTVPGERIMNPDFGVGLSTFLFEGYSDGVNTTTSTITNVIMVQTRRYMPYISIEDIIFAEGSEDDPHLLELRLIYSIPVLDDVVDPETGSYTLDFRGVQGDANITWTSPETSANSDAAYYRRIL